MTTTTYVLAADIGLAATKHVCANAAKKWGGNWWPRPPMHVQAEWDIAPTRDVYLQQQSWLDAAALRYDYYTDALQEPHP